MCLGLILFLLAFYWARFYSQWLRLQLRRAKLGVNETLKINSPWTELKHIYYVSVSQNGTIVNATTFSLYWCSAWPIHCPLFLFPLLFPVNSISFDQTIHLQYRCQRKGETRWRRRQLWVAGRNIAKERLGKETSTGRICWWWRSSYGHRRGKRWLV